MLTDEVQKIHSTSYFVRLILERSKQKCQGFMIYGRNWSVLFSTGKSSGDLRFATASAPITARASVPTPPLVYFFYNVSTVNDQIDSFIAELWIRFNVGVQILVNFLSMFQIVHFFNFLFGKKLGGEYKCPNHNNNLLQIQVVIHYYNNLPVELSLHAYLHCAPF